MKSYRQKLNIWIDEKIDNEVDQFKIDLLKEIKMTIKSMEDYEQDMVNRSYEAGYIDGVKNNGRLSNYYKEKYKLHDILKNMLS